MLVAGPAEPAYQRKLERMARRYRVEDQVRFVGSVAGPDKSYLLGRASWFLLPSKQENFGISVLEAINAGCPVAISDQVYLSDDFPDQSEVLPVRLDAWVEFLRYRMPDEQHRQALVRIEREYSGPQVLDGCSYQKLGRHDRQRVPALTRTARMTVAARNGHNIPSRDGK